MLPALALQYSFRFKVGESVQCWIYREDKPAVDGWVDFAGTLWQELEALLHEHEASGTPAAVKVRITADPAPSRRTYARRLPASPGRPFTAPCPLDAPPPQGCGASSFLHVDKRTPERWRPKRPHRKLRAPRDHELGPVLHAKNHGEARCHPLRPRSR